MAYNSKHTGEEVEEILDSVEGKQDKLNYYSEDTTYGDVTIKPDRSLSLSAPNGGIGISASNGSTIVYGYQAYLQSNETTFISAGDTNTSIALGSDSVEIKTNGKATYNGKEIATVDDIKGGGYSYWNYYFFEGSSNGDSVVTIDGEDVNIPANTIVEGNFTDDITAIPTNNLKRIITRGDITLSICNSSSSANTILEEVDMEFTKSFSRSFDYMFYNLQGLRRLRVVGSTPNAFASTFFYVGASTDGGCDVDVKGMTVDSVIMTSLFSYAKIISLDVSGWWIRTRDFVEGATIKSLNASGCVFHTANVIITSVNCFVQSTIGSLNLAGADFSEVRGGALFGANNINSINLSGIKIPAGTGSFSQINFFNSLASYNLDSETEHFIGAITGPLGFSVIPPDMSAIHLEKTTFDRQSLLVIFSALEEATVEQVLTGTASITLSSESYASLTEYDIAVATLRNWAIMV